MIYDLTKGLLATLLSSALLTNSAVAASQTDVQTQLPDIGTAAESTLSVNQELVLGDFLSRQLRGRAPLIYDPLLTGYINQLGQRLATKADSVRTPFHFYLVRNDELNAFAFFGGNIVLHSGLFAISDNESQLASVLAHEISHVTQRHLARAMEAQKRNAPLTWAGALGSLLLTLANPEAGMAALSGTLAGSQQSAISFTQANEQEADRIGIRVLASAGFDPKGMPDFMQKLLDQSRHASRPPEILLTHPLPESRLADARNRAGQMPPRVVDSSQAYLFAKARILTMYSNQDKRVLDEWLTTLGKGNVRAQNAAQYGRAVMAYEQKKYDQAASILQPLLAKESDNIWFLDLMTDINLGRRQYAVAITRLESEIKSQPKEPVLQINLANAYLDASRSADASKLLYRYTYDNPNDLNGWELLAKASADQGKRDEELAARAENMALTGNLAQAIQLLSNASSQAKVGSLNQARYDARIDQFRELQKRFQPFEK